MILLSDYYFGCVSLIKCSSYPFPKAFGSQLWPKDCGLYRERWVLVLHYPMHNLSSSNFRTVNGMKHRITCLIALNEIIVPRVTTWQAGNEEYWHRSIKTALKKTVTNRVKEIKKEASTFTKSKHISCSLARYPTVGWLLSSHLWFRICFFFSQYMFAVLNKERSTSHIFWW